MKEKNKYTRYEKTRIVSSRALQIAQGSPVLISTPKHVIDPTEIAKMEWDAGVIPIDISTKKIDAAHPGNPAKHTKNKDEKPTAKTAKASKPARKSK